MLNEQQRARLGENLVAVRARLEQAAGRAGRDPGAVRLVAVTKYAALDVARALLDLGVRDLGENRVQQLGARAEELGAADTGLATEPGAAGPPIWHMIGHLQRNKVRSLLRHVRIVQSLDSLRLADELETEAARIGKTVEVLIEVNVAGEAAKSGAPLEVAEEVAGYAAACAHLRLNGLMTMAPYDPDSAQARPYFSQLRELLERFRQRGVVPPECTHLSMGMSGDYEVAVEEGATIVRLGSVLLEGIEPH